MWRRVGDQSLFSCRSRVPWQIALLFSGRCSQNRQQECRQGSRSMDGQLEAFLLRNEPRFDAMTLLTLLLLQPDHVINSPDISHNITQPLLTLELTNTTAVRSFFVSSLLLYSSIHLLIPSHQHILLINCHLTHTTNHFLIDPLTTHFSLEESD